MQQLLLCFLFFSGQVFGMATSQEDSTFKWLAERRQPLMMNSYPSFVKALPACLHGLEQYTVVGLGEGTHGTSEFQTVRTYITRYLVEERSEEHTSELQSQLSISYAVFCLKKIMVALC